MEQICILHNNRSIGYFKAYGSFGELFGELVVDGNTVSVENSTVKMTSKTKEYENGIFIRCDEIENMSDEPIYITDLKSVFSYTYSDYEIYTQVNSWQHESEGKWVPLSTTISVSGETTRSSHDTAPFLAVWDKQVNRGMVYHVIPNGSWSMSASRKHANGETSYLCVEMGYESRRFKLTLAPGEKVALPEIIYYEATNKMDLDGWKLHSYWNKTYPRRELPVVYNTWLAKFDQLDYDSIKEQIILAEEIGAEYFVTDAGWFGYGDTIWAESIGDWVENTQFGYAGKMKEISDLVRKHNMKFGLWFEPERALPTSKSYTEHPEFYIKGSHYYYPEMGFLDFSNPDAREFMIDIMSQQIERCGIEYIKFDYNMPLAHDIKEDAFISYFNGYNEFFRCLREKFPNIYWMNCAGGGGRLNLANCMAHDSFWYTDNQNTYSSMEMLKGTIFRMPAQVLDRWATIGTIPNATPSGNELMFTIGDAAWRHIVGIDSSYLYAFLTGGPLGLSFDLTKISGKVFEGLKEHIAQFKADREFWKSADCRIIADGSEIFALEYSSEGFKKNVVQVFAGRYLQEGIRIYPALNPDAIYTLPDGTKHKGKTITDKGVYIPVSKLYSASTVVIESEG